MTLTRRRSWRIAPRVLALSSFIAVNAHAQDTYELRCRGGADAFSVERLDASTFSLDFTAGPAAAAADGSGLEPGTCSWIDRVLNNEEPRQIQFSTARSRGPSVSIHLSDPANFWSFFVYNTNNGYFQSGGRHSEWTKAALADKPAAPSPTAPPSGGAAPASSGGAGAQTARRGGNVIAKPPILEGAVNPNAKSDPYPYEEDVNQLAKASSYTLSNVRVEPGQKFVNITFVSLTGATPLVEVGQASPKLVGDSWTYRDATVKVPAVPVRADSDKPISRYAVSVQSLQPGAEYHYLITVPSRGDTRGRQQTGSFTTLSRTVTVVFTQVHILNDSDENSDGDLVFRFHVNGQDRQWGDFLRRDKISIEDGGKRNLQNVIQPVEIQNAPDNVKIHVDGYDHDGDIIYEIAPSDWKSYPSSNGGWEWNVVDFSFDVSKYPGNTTQYFTRQSWKLYPGRGVTLMFEVSGRIEISNP